MIHQYRLGGYHIALDVGSGAVHLLDELSYDLLRLLPEPMPDSCPEEVLRRLGRSHSPAEIQEAFSELSSLCEMGQLMSDDAYDSFENLLVDAPIKAMCLHVAHDCNLRCEYCFAATGKYMGGRALMSEEVAKRAVDFLIQRSEGRHNLELDFFGGEPLMNWDVVTETVRYAREQERIHHKNFRFTITTNGVMLDDDKIDFINREMSNVVLSLDGRKEVHDRLRVRVDGSGSYDAIVPKFQKLVARRDPERDYYVRGTFTRHNLDFAEDVLHLSALGFDQVSVEPVVSDASIRYAITEADIPAISAEYDRLSELLIERHRQGRGTNFFHFMLDLDQGPCAIKRLRGCGCGNEYVAVTPTGDLYPCHQFVGHEEWRMGSVLDLSLDTEIKAAFAKTNVLTKPDCAVCWAKYYCSGGCSANGMQYEGDIHKLHTISCALQRKRLECAIMMKAALLDGVDY